MDGWLKITVVRLFLKYICCGKLTCVCFRDEDAALSRFSPNVVSYALGDGSKSPRSTVESRDTPSRSQSRQSQNGSRSVWFLTIEMPDYRKEMSAGH